MTTFKQKDKAMAQTRSPNKVAHDVVLVLIKHAEGEITNADIERYTDTVIRHLVPLGNREAIIHSVILAIEQNRESFK